MKRNPFSPHLHANHPTVPAIAIAGTVATALAVALTILVYSVGAIT